MKMPNLPRWTRAVPILALGLAALAVASRESQGSDHMDTVLVELNPQLDVNDVWAFPGSSDDRIVLAVTYASPFKASGTPAGLFSFRQRFDPNALYQIHVDNNNDGVEDVVFQFSFDEMMDGSQTVDVLGPVPPAVRNFSDQITGQGGTRYRFSTAQPTFKRVPVNTVRSGAIPSSSGNMQFFAGVRDDPFYLDLEQFFRIVPDRRPTQGPLALIGGATPPPPGTISAAFRPDCGTGTTPPANSAPFDGRFGCAMDFFRGFNALAIVVEVPERDLTFGRNNGQIGIWATVSH